MARSTDGDMDAGDGMQPTSITKCLGGMDFPAYKDDIMEYAEDNDADDELLETLEKLPDRQYGSVAEVVQGIGQSRQA